MLGRAFFQRSLKEVQLSFMGSNPGRGIRWLEKSKMPHRWANMEINSSLGTKYNEKNEHQDIYPIIIFLVTGGGNIFFVVSEKPYWSSCWEN